MRAAVTLLLLWAGLFTAAGAESVPAGPPKSDTDRISVDFPNEEIRTILRNVADLYELNLVFPEDLQGRASVTLRDATWRQIFRKALYPVGYDFELDENIVRVFSLSRRPLPVFPSLAASRGDNLAWAALLALRSLPYVTLLPLLVVHLILCGAVVRDRGLTKPRFAPKTVWVLLVLIGGFAPLLAYWLMHHSTLAPPTATNADA